MPNLSTDRYDMLRQECKDCPWLTIKPDGTEEGWQGDRHPTLEEMQGWVGGYIEHVVVNLNGRKCDALINEEGKLQGLPVNAKGTEMYVYGAEDPIVGNIAIFEEGRLE